MKYVRAELPAAIEVVPALVRMPVPTTLELEFAVTAASTMPPKRTSNPRCDVGEGLNERVNGYV